MEKLNIYEFIYYRFDDLIAALIKHIEITGMAVTLAIVVGVPIGIMITRKRNIANLVINIANVFQTLPSLALFGLIIPFLGIGVLPAVFVLFLYALLPIIKNTYIGITNVDPAAIDAGIGMGLTSNQILTMIEIPLALPVIMGGIRVSTVINIGTATIAALIGAGGLGEFIFKGLSMNNNNMILMGALPSALLAIVVDFIFGKIEKALIPRGIQN
ncbi:osmoprotectant transport system permease protein [Hypnocyclicus thermotrophus]|uniref:Osmoprotectant transport system permease protein n=1 Tax=Hypnocyclicus thermotrophus TaxID=1627895 RepID=A0AA46DZP8_9FUSO|nr:ABC transporter permease [Hypnocyclicus thermotrophus]TDT71572.1 osmoprotectant transport system permease protein [Hypnocyclicus thermotrophus]